MVSVAGGIAAHTAGIVAAGAAARAVPVATPPPGAPLVTIVATTTYPNVARVSAAGRAPTVLAVFVRASPGGAVDGPPGIPLLKSPDMEAGACGSCPVVAAP